VKYERNFIRISLKEELLPTSFTGGALKLRAKSNKIHDVEILKHYLNLFVAGSLGIGLLAILS
jgi:hypothetical protein